MTISPGSTSRMKSAPRMSRAQVSDARIAGILEAAQDERPHAQGIAHADDAAVEQAHQRPGALDLAERVGDAAEDALLAAPGDQVDDHLGVGGGVEKGAILNELPAQAERVGEVAVVGDGEPAEGEVGEERLDVAQPGSTGGGVAGVTDGGVAGQALDHGLAGEAVADQAGRLVMVEVLAVEADDAGGLLPAMLERVQAQGRVGRGPAMAVDGEDAALLVELVVVEGRAVTHRRSFRAWAPAGGRHCRAARRCSPARQSRWWTRARRWPAPRAAGRARPEGWRSRAGRG